MGIQTFFASPVGATGALTAGAPAGSLTKTYNGNLPALGPATPISALVPLLFGDSVAIQNSGGGSIRVGGATGIPLFYADTFIAPYALGNLVGQQGWIRGVDQPLCDDLLPLIVTASGALGGTRALADSPSTGVEIGSEDAKPFLSPLPLITPFVMEWPMFLTATSPVGARMLLVSAVPDVTIASPSVFTVTVHDTGIVDIGDNGGNVFGLAGGAGLHDYMVSGDAAGNLYYTVDGALIHTGSRIGPINGIDLQSPGGYVDPSTGSILFGEVSVKGNPIPGGGFLLPAGTGIVLSAQLGPIDLTDLCLATNAGDAAAGASLLVVGH